MTVQVTRIDEAPSAMVASANQSVVEGLSEARKLIDISFVDDGLGINAVAVVTSPLFEIRNGTNGISELWLKAGVMLNAGTTYNIMLTPQVSGIGTPPPDQTFTLDVTPLVEVTGRLTAREDSPWMDPSGTFVLNDPDSNSYALFVNGTHIGADDTSVSGTYGTLTVDQNGIWEYVLDNSNAAVEALDGDDDDTDGAKGAVTETITLTYISNTTENGPKTFTKNFDITIDGLTDYYSSGFRSLRYSNSGEDLSLHSTNIWTASRVSLSGGFGDDVLNGGRGANFLTGNRGNDVINSNEGVYNQLYGGPGNDTLNGGSIWLTSHNFLYGGEGNDILNAGSSYYMRISRLSGGSGDDVLNGGSNNDSLSGGADADVLTGAAGNDTLGGGEGDDIFVLNLSGTSNDIDIVTDFSFDTVSGHSARNGTTSGGNDRIRIDTDTGSETTLDALKLAVNIRWTNDANVETRASRNDAAVNDTIIYATQGTVDTADDIILMVLEDFIDILTISHFDIV